MANRNLHSTSKLTEFAPLSPEDKQSGIGNFISKIFKLNRGDTTEKVLSQQPVNDNNVLSQEGVKDQTLPIVSSPSTADQNFIPGTQFPVDIAEGRSLQYVLKRISNLLALKNVGRQEYRDTDLKQYWMPDSVSRECYDCGERFTTFRRRHHCRICGQIFCSRCCCQEVPGKIVGCSGDLRVCTYCCKVVLSYLQSADMTADLSADLRAVQEDLQSKFGSTSSLPASNVPSPGRATLATLTYGGTIEHEDVDTNIGPSPSAYATSSVKRKHSLGYQEERFALGRDQQVSESLPEEGRNWFLRALCEELVRPGRALPMQAVRIRLRVHQGVFTGSQLIDWLVEHGKAHDREEGFALGEALVQAGFIEGISENNFTDGCALYRLLGAEFSNESFEQINDVDTSEVSTAGQEGQEPSWVKEIPHRHHDSTTTTDSEPECTVSGVEVDDNSSLPSSSSMFCLNLNLKQSTVHLMRPPPCSSPSHSTGSTTGDGIPQHTAEEVAASNELLNYTLLRSSQGNQNKKPVPWHQTSQLRSDNGDLQVYTALNETFSLHERTLLTQLLNAESLSMSWVDIVMPLVHQMVSSIQPNINNDTEEMDIKHYIQFKKVVGGQRSECQIVNGIVCTKNVAHRSMVSRLENPRILLLNGAIVYQRAEGRLLSLEPVMRQEQEYLRNVVARIESLQPDLILVSRNVSRLAQESLRLQGVTLALNVKLSVLERVARCTQARIISSVDSQIGRPQLGTCKTFYVRTFKTERGASKTLMFFEGCPLPRLGCSVLLRGGTQLELSRLKKVMRHLAFARYNWRLELSYLMDECACPPNVASDAFFEETSFNQRDKKFESDRFSIPDESVSVMSSDIESNNSMECLGAESKLSENSQSLDVCATPMNIYRSEEQTAKGQNQLKVRRDLNENNDSILSRSRRSISSSDQYDILRRSTAESIIDFSDPLHQYLNLGEEDFRQEDCYSQQLAVAKMPFLNHFRKALDDTILSVSPHVKFTVPFLETEFGRSCALRQFFPEEIFKSHQFSQNKTSRSRLGTTLVSDGHTFQADTNSLMLGDKHPFVVAKLTCPIENPKLQELLAHFRACGGRISVRQGLQLSPLSQGLLPCQAVSEDGSKDVLNPENHQHLYVLFCSFSPLSQNAPDFCVNPWVVKMDFYGRNDISLGSFLKRYCFRTSYECPSSNCNTPMLKHTRRFVHFPGCVQVTLQLVEGTDMLPSPDHILMWTCCSLCSVVSPVVPMSQDTKCLSFGKYLELRFHGDMYRLREEDTDSTSPCSHSLHHDFYQYFGYRNVVASFKYTPIFAWEVSLPPQMVKLEWESQYLKVATDELGQIAVAGQQVFSHVLERLFEISPEDAVLKVQLQKDQAQFKAKVDDALTVGPPMSELEQWELLWRWEDAIVDLLRTIIDAVSTWNTRLLSVDPRLPRPVNKSYNLMLDTADELASQSIEESHKNAPAAELALNSDLMRTVSGTNSPPSSASFSQSSVGNDSSMSIEDQNSQEKQVSSNAYEKQVQPHHQQRRSSSSDQETDVSVEPAEYLVINSNELPAHQSTQSKSVKTILSQLLPSGPITTPIMVPPQFQEIHIMARGSAKIPIAVRESQPSTIIAHALASHEYQRNLEEMLQMSQIETSSSPPPQVASKKTPGSSDRDRDKEKDRDSLNGDLSQSSEYRRVGMLSFLRGTPSTSVKDSGSIEGVAYSTSSFANPFNSHPIESTGGNTAGSNTSAGNSPQPQATQPNTAYIEVQFSDSSANFYCRIYYADEFRKLRRLVWPTGEEGFIRSLAHCVQWAARGGKSGSSFCKSRDDRLVLKEMSRPELSHFLERAPRYFQYITHSHREHRPTLLGKILGVYRIVFKNDVTGTAFRSNLLVIENLFYGREVSHRFDLKGSVRNRMVNPGSEPRGEIVLLDENLLKLTRDNPLYVLPHSKTVLNQAICRDTDFLASQSVMDYSLLVGLDEARKELVVGIIDYIRSFTWDKRLENVLKKMANQGKAPTIVQPEEYKKRFIAAMHSYFLTAPDRWYGFGHGFEI